MPKSGREHPDWSQLKFLLVPANVMYVPNPLPPHDLIINLLLQHILDKLPPCKIMVLSDSTVPDKLTKPNLPRHRLLSACFCNDTLVVEENQQRFHVSAQDYAHGLFITDETTLPLAFHREAPPIWYLPKTGEMLSHPSDDDKLMQFLMNDRHPRAVIFLNVAALFNFPLFHSLVAANPKIKPNEIAQLISDNLRTLLLLPIWRETFACLTNNPNLIIVPLFPANLPPSAVDWLKKTNLMQAIKIRMAENSWLEDKITDNLPDNLSELSQKFRLPTTVARILISPTAADLTEADEPAYLAAQVAEARNALRILAFNSSDPPALTFFPEFLAKLHSLESYFVFERPRTKNWQKLIKQDVGLSIELDNSIKYFQEVFENISTQLPKKAEPRGFVSINDDKTIQEWLEWQRQIKLGTVNPFLPTGAQDSEIFSRVTYWRGQPRTRETIQMQRAFNALPIWHCQTYVFCPKTNSLYFIDRTVDNRQLPQISRLSLTPAIKALCEVLSQKNVAAEMDDGLEIPRDLTVKELREIQNLLGKKQMTLAETLQSHIQELETELEIFSSKDLSEEDYPNMQKGVIALQTIVTAVKQGLIAFLERKEFLERSHEEIRVETENVSLLKKPLEERRIWATLLQNTQTQITSWNDTMQNVSRVIADNKVLLTHLVALNEDADEVLSSLSDQFTQAAEKIDLAPIKIPEPEPAMPEMLNRDDSSLLPGAISPLSSTEQVKWLLHSAGRSSANSVPLHTPCSDTRSRKNSGVSSGVPESPFYSMQKLQSQLMKLIEDQEVPSSQSSGQASMQPSAVFCSVEPPVSRKLVKTNSASTAQLMAQHRDAEHNKKTLTRNASCPQLASMAAADIVPNRKLIAV